MRKPAALVAVAALLLALLLPSPAPAQQAPSFVEAWQGRPAAPQPWNPRDWDVAVHDNDLSSPSQYDPMPAHHGHDCAGHPATHQTDRSAAGFVFLCNDHMMTAITGGYGLVALTPPVLADFSQGPATVAFDVSTLRSENRDWWEVVLTPYDDFLNLSGRDGQEPRNAVKILLGHTMTDPHLFIEVIRNGVKERLPSRLGRPAYKDWLTFSAVRRDRFEARVERGHFYLGMPGYGVVLYDTPMAPLGWDRALVTISHHSYAASKDCDPSVPPTDCGPGTWHWDNLSIQPAVPITIIRGDKAILDHTGAGGERVVTFDRPAPANARISYEQYAGTEVSLDGGPWGTLAPGTPHTQHPQHIFAPVPEGTQRAAFRPTGGGAWYVRGFSLLSQGTPPAVTPTPPPPATAAPTFTPAPTATATGTPTPSPSPSPAATASSTAQASATPAPTFTAAPSATATPTLPPTATAPPGPMATVACTAGHLAGGVFYCTARQE